jgi:hypothetical protein
MKTAYPQLKLYDTKLSRSQNAEARKFVENILEIRNGRTLTLAERIRAEELADAADQYRYPGMSRMIEIRDQAKLLHALGELSPEQTLAEMARRPETLGFKKLPAELRPLVGKEALNEAEVELAAKAIRDQRDVLRADLKKHKSADYRWYMNNPLEAEAYPVGLLAFWLTNARNNGNFKPVINNAR